MATPGVASTRIVARTVDQPAGNLAAASRELGETQSARLDDVGAITPNFSAAPASPRDQAHVFGGRDLRGWGE